MSMRYASTILSRSPTSILSHLSRLPEDVLSNSHPLLFTLSANLNAPDLSSLVSCLTALSPRQSIGCLSAPLPYFTDFIACSIAVFDGSDARIFRSTIPGRAAPQVGRWHAFRKKDTKIEATDEALVNGVDIWDRSVGDDALPQELRNLSFDDVNTVLYLSDIASEGLSNSLTAFTRATKLGLTASSTPFITGRPVTLFHNKSIYSSGAVGIALASGKYKPRTSVEFSGLHAITGPLTVTRSEGNLVNELNHSNPTRRLLAAVKESGIENTGSFKEDEFYLGALQQEKKLSQVYRITSGDPSRGTIAVESHAAPSEGTLIQFYHRSKSIASDVPLKYDRPQPDRCVLSFAASSDLALQVTNDEVEAPVQVLHNTFMASSENGFSASRGEEPAWRCTVPGALASLEW